MAASSYFPSIYDKTENQEIWSFPNPDLKRIKSLPRRGSGAKSGFVNQSGSTAQRVEAPAACKALNLLKVPDYRPLDVFSVAGEDRGPAPRSEVDEICELCIQLKEFELCEMMEDRPRIHHNKFQRTFRICRERPRRRRIERKHVKKQQAF